jgi:hypothetical protein
VEGASSFFKSIDLQTDEMTSLVFFHTETYKRISNLSNEQGELTRTALSDLNAHN